jgi:hypothetical protein
MTLEMTQSHKILKKPINWINNVLYVQIIIEKLDLIPSIYL